MSENLIRTDENGVRHCIQCPNQCPEDALKCGRGRRLFGTEDSQEGGEQHGHGHGHGHGHDHSHGNDHGHGHDNAGTKEEERKSGS